MLGTFAEATFEEATLRLDSGATLLMFSDCVTEARDTRDEEVGEARLLAFVSAQPVHSAAEMLEGTLGAVLAFCGPTRPADDVTVTVTRCR